MAKLTEEKLRELLDLQYVRPRRRIERLAADPRRLAKKLAGEYGLSGKIEDESSIKYTNGRSTVSLRHQNGELTELTIIDALWNPSDPDVYNWEWEEGIGELIDILPFPTWEEIKTIEGITVNAVAPIILSEGILREALENGGYSSAIGGVGSSWEDFYDGHDEWTIVKVEGGEITEIRTHEWAVGPWSTAQTLIETALSEYVYE